MPCHTQPTTKSARTIRAILLRVCIATHRRRIVRILFVDDKESDVELCLQELKRMDFAVSSDWVQIPAEFRKRLRTQSYDVIVCDYSMPELDGNGGTRTFARDEPGNPIHPGHRHSGRGHDGCVHPEGRIRLCRQESPEPLPLAVALAVEEKSRREERNHAEKELRHSEAHYRALVENPTYGICHFDVDGRFLDVNAALVAMLGYGSKEELIAVNLATEIIRDPIERAQLFESYRQTGHVDLIEVEWKRKDGTPMKVRLSGQQVGVEAGSARWVRGHRRGRHGATRIGRASASLGSNRCAHRASELPPAFRNTRIGDQTFRPHRTGLCRAPL